jgi:Fe-S-cluster-containing dehydrogenase component
MIDYQKCIGCGACVEHCPYQAREFVRDNRILYPDGETEFERPSFDKIPVNTPLKCDFCYHRVDRGDVPACVEVCPTKARVFGDLEDSRSEVSQLREKFSGWQILPEANTRPCVYYIGE